jgi:Cu-processing system ATP-binding protein
LSELDELTTHVMYLQEGRVQFFKGIGALREETGELKLGKAVAQIMNGELNPDWVNDLFDAKNEKP